VLDEFSGEHNRVLKPATPTLRDAILVSAGDPGVTTGSGRECLSLGRRPLTLSGQPCFAQVAADLRAGRRTDFDAKRGLSEPAIPVSRPPL
jgi:hypothetical protein